MKYSCSKEVGDAKDVNTCADIYDLEKLAAHHIEKKETEFTAFYEPYPLGNGRRNKTE
jgi:hypothetical protein